MAQYEIIIKNESGGGSESPISGDQKNVGNEDSAISKELQSAFKKIVSYQTAKSLVVSAINHEVSLVQLRTGNNELQQRASFVNSVVQQAVGFVESVAIGAKAGGWVGAIVGAVMSTATTVIGIAQKQDTIDKSRQLENATLQMNYVRAGARGSRGGYSE